MKNNFCVLLLGLGAFAGNAAPVTRLVRILPVGLPGDDDGLTCLVMDDGIVVSSTFVESNPAITRIRP